MKPNATFAELVDLAELAMVTTSTGPAPMMRPLSPRHRAPNRVMRPGALDYQTIPSLHGNTRVPFKSSIACADGVEQE